MTPFFENGMIRQAVKRDIIRCSAINIRDFASDKHKTTDDKPYGGGCGMVMKPEPLAGAIRAARKRSPSSVTVAMTPQGRPFTQKVATELSRCDGLNLVCGRYEGFDERILETLIDDEISIGDYVLTGGELPAMVVIDAVARLIPGVLGGEDSAEKDSFVSDLLEHGHYTRPYCFEDMKVPDILMSGHHKNIEKWRLEMSVKRTFLKRPDLFDGRTLGPEEKEILKQWCLRLEKLVRD